MTIPTRILHNAKSLVIDAAAWTIACLCDHYPRIDERMQVYRLQHALMVAHQRIAHQAQTIADYRAAYELQHGSTVDLPSLTDDPITATPRKDLN